MFPRHSLGYGGLDCADQLDIPDLTPRYEELKNAIYWLHRLATEAHPVRWDSHIFPPDPPPLRIDQLESLFEEVRDPNSPLRREVRSELIEKSGGLHSRQFWDLYLGGPYESIVSFVPEYLQIFLRINEILPKSGTHFDGGSGSGNGLVLLQTLAPRRTLLGYDSSALAIYTSRKKLKRLRLTRPRVYERNLTEITAKNKWTGAFLVNSLYSLRDREHVLKLIYRALKIDGILVINDPLPKSALPEQKIFSQQSIIRSAILNGSRADAYNVALVMASNYEKLMLPENFLSPEQMIQMLTSIGFEVKREKDSYFGACGFYVARKPFKYQNWPAK